MPTIDILLATYNGAAWLPEQLASLAAQTFTDWRVILRDDGSSDGSADLVRRWAADGGHSLIVIEDGRSNLGAKGNFAALIEASDAPYFVCCDQDDVWLTHKLELMLAALQAAEAAPGADRPALAYSDLEVVDAALNRIAPSMRAYASLQQPRPGREVIDLMTQNVVTGCASLGNAALRRAALPVPPEAVMHDWWLALVAAATGTLVDVPEATIRYRQHGGNAVGALRWTAGAVMRLAVSDFRQNLGRVRAFAVATPRQAKALVERHGEAMEASQLAIATEFSSLRDQPILRRKRFAWRHLFQGSEPLRRATLLAFI